MGSRLIPAAPKPVHFIEGRKSAGILDDFAVRKNVATKEGTIEQVPTNDNHIVNKKYVDDSVGAIDLSGLVPYTGATSNVNLGSENLTTTGIITAEGGFVSDPIDYDWSGMLGYPIVNRISTSVDLEPKVVMGAINVISPSEPYVYPDGSGLAFMNEVPADALGGAGQLFGIFGINVVKGPSSEVDMSLVAYGAYLDTHTINDAYLYSGNGASVYVGAYHNSYMSEAVGLDIHVTKDSTASMDVATGILIADMPETNISSRAIQTGTGEVVFGDDVYAEADLYVDGNVKATGYKSSDGSAGITTTFIDADGNTIGVKNGLIVSKTAP